MQPRTAHDLVLRGGNVITLDEASRVAEAVAVTKGRIAAVGSTAGVMQGAGPATEIVDLHGRTVTPGFFDGHPHMDRQGLRQCGGLSLDGCRSIADILDVVRDAVARTPAGEWIVLMPMGGPLAYVYRPEGLADRRYPTRHDLDAVAPDHPVIVRPPWGWWTHRPLPCVVNTRALAVAGVTGDSRTPYKVDMLKDADGEPTGVFLDHNFSPLLEYTLMSSVPRFTYEDRLASVRDGSSAYSALGTTAGYEGHGLSVQLLQAYERIHARGELTVRMQASLSVPTAAFGNRKIADMLEHWAPRLSGRGEGDDTLRLEGIALDIGEEQPAKVIASGYPYEHWAGHYRQCLSFERLVELGLLAAKLGLRVNCCVPFDTERVLRAFEAINEQVRIVDRRWVMIHVSQVSADQLRRMKALGIIATVNPNFMYMASDRNNLQKLGPDGTPIRQLLDAGIPTVLSTDNVPPSMLFSMSQALTRWDNDSGTRLGESHLTREEALRLSTKAGHWLTWREDESGSISLGQTADLAVLSDNPLTTDEFEIRNIKAEQTYLGGKRVFQGSTTDCATAQA